MLRRRRRPPLFPPFVRAIPAPIETASPQARPAPWHDYNPCALAVRALSDPDRCAYCNGWLADEPHRRERD